MGDFDLTERLIPAAEFATMLVKEDDVLEWMLAGHIPYVEGPEGEPRVRISEEHTVDVDMPVKPVHRVAEHLIVDAAKPLLAARALDRLPDEPKVVEELAAMLTVQGRSLETFAHSQRSERGGR